MPLEKSLCNRCSDPGACCRRFSLNTAGDYSRFSVWLRDAAPTVPERIEAMNAKVRERGLPFRVVEETISSTPEGEFASYTFHCPELLEGGRCGIYRRRPEVCRDFKAGSGPLCVMYKPEEDDDAVQLR